MEHKRDPLNDADDIQFRLSCGIGALSAIHTAMESGPFEPTNLLDALFGVYDYLGMLNDQLRGCINGCYEARNTRA